MLKKESLDKIINILEFCEKEIGINIEKKIKRQNEIYINHILESFGESELFITKEESAILLKEYEKQKRKNHTSTKVMTIQEQNNLIQKLKEIISVITKKYNAQINPLFLLYDITKNDAQETHKILKEEDRWDCMLTTAERNYYTYDELFQIINKIIHPVRLVKKSGNCWTKAQIPQLVNLMKNWPKMWQKNSLVRNIIEIYHQMDILEYVERNHISLTKEEWLIIKYFSECFNQARKILVRYQKLYPNIYDMPSKKAMKKMFISDRKQLIHCFKTKFPKKNDTLQNTFLIPITYNTPSNLMRKKERGC